MNIFIRELKANYKPFLFWSLGLFILTFAGMTKYTGVQTGGVDTSAIFAQFPKLVLALLGMANADVKTPGGYYSVISYFAIICASVYAVSLGFNAVSREAADKTEFLFTKPRSRGYILSKKIEAGIVFITLFNLLNLVFSSAAIRTLKVSDDLTTQIFLFCAAVYLVSLVFFSLSALCSALAGQTEKGSLLGNFIFLFAFVIGIVCDMLESPGVLKIFSPIKYFSPSDLLENKFSIPYTFLCLMIIVLSLYVSFKSFKRKDLSAV